MVFFSCLCADSSCPFLLIYRRTRAAIFACWVLNLEIVQAVGLLEGMGDIPVIFISLFACVGLCESSTDSPERHFVSFLYTGGGFCQILAPSKIESSTFYRLRPSLHT